VSKPTKVVLLTLTIAVLGFVGLVKAYIPAADADRVILYTTRACPYCAALRRTLDSNGIPYTDRDVARSLVGAVGFLFLGGRGGPVSVIGPEIVYGYNEKIIADRLAAIGYPIDGGSDQRE